MIANCRIGAGGKTLWVSFGDDPVALCIKRTGNYKLPSSLLELADRQVDFAKLRSVVPALEVGPFVPAFPTAFAELRRETPDWQLTVVQPSALLRNRAQKQRQVVELSAWVERHLG